MQVGKITFGNSRIEESFLAIREELAMGKMWEQEFFRLDYEVSNLRDDVRRLTELISAKKRRKK